MSESRFSIRAFRDGDEEAVIALWRAAGLTRPWNDPRLDIERKRAVQRELFLLMEHADELVGTAMGGYDGHRGAVYYVAVHPSARGAGLGRALMRELEHRLTLLGCPKLNLQVRLDNTDALAFYERIGYRLDSVVSLGKRLIVDAPAATDHDVPSAIDLRQPDHAAAWAAEADLTQPERARIFAAVADQLARAGSERVLELGSGPGFLAAHLLTVNPSLSLTLLDFSEAMHAIARERLGPLAEHVRFVTADFREPGFMRELERYDAIISVQALHELRHKSRAMLLHARLKTLLARDGLYLVCDHDADQTGETSQALYMTLSEQRSALRAAGFDQVDHLLSVGTLVLLRARTR